MGELSHSSGPRVKGYMTARCHDDDSFANCNVNVKQENGLSLNLPETVMVYVGLALHCW